MAVRRLWQRWFSSWLERRLPRVPVVTLNRKSIFTFPSRSGFGFVGVLVVLWLLATNYENNLVFAFAALLGSVMVVSIFHGYSNLSGLSLRIAQVDNGFPGDLLKVDVELSQSVRKAREDIRLSFPGSDESRLSLGKDQQKAVASLFLPARVRGRQLVPRLTVETAHPLGLIRVWSHVLLSGYGLVYPRPVEGFAVLSGEGDEASDRSADAAGSEDFLGLDTYKQGEPVNRIAWKQLARGQGLYTKHFADPVADPQWLDWDHFPGMDREARLSRLCYQVLEASKKGHPYGLKLPGQSSALGEGESHRDRLLMMLAEFETGSQP